MGRWYLAAQALVTLAVAAGCGADVRIPFKPVTADQVPNQLVAWSKQEHDVGPSLAMITTADHEHVYIAISPVRCGASATPLKITQVVGTGTPTMGLTAKKTNPGPHVTGTFFELDWRWGLPPTPAMFVHGNRVFFSTTQYQPQPTDEVQVYHADTAGLCD